MKRSKNAFSSILMYDPFEYSVFLFIPSISLSHHISSSLLSHTKPITLLLESVAAKDMSCLIAGYCRVFVDPNLNIFPWIDISKKHRVSAEEGTEKEHIHTSLKSHTSGLYVTEKIRTINKLDFSSCS